MLPVLFLPVKSKRKAKALSPVLDWGELQSSIQQAVGDTRSAVCCTDVAQKSDAYLLRSPFRKGNC